MIHLIVLSRQANRKARNEEISHKLGEAKARQRQQLDHLRGMS